MVRPFTGNYQEQQQRSLVFASAPLGGVGMASITLKVEPLTTSEQQRPDHLAGHRGAAVGVLAAPGELDSVAPDLTAPVVGFRNWRIMRDGPRKGELSSPFIPIAWPEPVLRAECRRFGRAEDLLEAPHAAPDPACGCGICAYHSPTANFSKVDHLGVSGIVTVWGRIVADNYGMRAEQVRIAALGLYPRWTRRQQHAVREVAHRFGVDLVDLADLSAAARDYGQTLPPSLLTPRSGE
jgi:hypothetical protein